MWYAPVIQNKDECHADPEVIRGYLETMLMMREKHGYIRSVDVAAALSVTKPSVSYATRRLRENGYLTMDPTD
jgi:Mn-dependent DtxR family transcriptional regulator